MNNNNHCHNNILTVHISLIVMLTLLSGCSLDFLQQKNKIEEIKKPEAIMFYLNGNLPQFNEGSNPLSAGVLSQFQLEKRLKKAASDKFVKEAVLHFGGIGIGWARAKELEKAILVFAKKKPLTCVLESADNKTYALAAASCPKILIAPAGGIDLIGLGMESVYLKDLLDALGVKADMLHVGKYKSAAENVTLNQMSDAAREATTSLLKDINKRFIQSIASARHLDVKKVKELIDNGPYTAKEALKAGLVDKIESIGLVMSRLENTYAGGINKHYGRKKTAEIDLSSIIKMFSKNTDKDSKDSSLKVAVIPVLGTINSGPDSNSFLGKDSSVHDLALIDTLAKAAADNTVKAVVLRIDSPGGSALASDNIWEAVRALNKKKPVITSMGDVAASGGYYIACATRYIFADKDTITGSIGVVGGKVVFGDALEKIGVHKDGIVLGKHSTMMSPFTPFTEDEKKVVYRSMETMYNLFVKRVATGRNLKESDVRKIAEGRVWTGGQALKIGLVDKAGTLVDAIAEARKIAGVKGLKVVLYPKPKSFMESLGEQLAGEDVTLGFIKSFKAGREALKLGLLLNKQQVLAFCPYYIDIN